MKKILYTIPIILLMIFMVGCKDKNDKQKNSEINNYTITWSNFDGSIIEIDQNVKEGTMPTFDSSNPVRPSDDNYDYHFAGWNPEIKEAYGNQTYVAKYEARAKTDNKSDITVTFKTNSNTTIDSQNLEKGDRIVDCIYDDAKEQNEFGYIAVKKNGLWGCLDKEGNVIETKGNERVCTDNNFTVRASSRMRYAVCLDNDIAFDASYRFTDSKRPEIFGDLYGNNHMISATREQFENDDNPMLAVEWSDVTISNIILRANAIEGDEINKETKTLRGHILDINATDMAKRYSFLNINIEYSILENAATASHIFAVEATLKGCIIRNMSNTGMYAAQRVRHNKENIYILPVDLTLENMIFSNCLGTSFDFDTDLFEVSDRQNHNTYNFGKTKEESDEYIRNNLLR